MVSIGEGNDGRSVNSQFLVVPCRSVYNFIMRRPFTSTLDTVPSLVYLKIKYHNIQGESDIINADLEGEKRIYQEL